MISFASLKEERALETYQPHQLLNCLLITLRFEPKMIRADSLESKVSTVSRKAEKMLSEKYAGQQLQDFLVNLQQAFHTLNYHTYKKSIAVFVSSDTCKVLYLDINLDEEIYFTAFPDVTDILRLQRAEIRFLVLVLNSKWSKTYLGTETGLQLIKVDIQRPDTVTSLSQTNHAECSRSLCIDTSNDFQLICNAYELPVFVLGNVTRVDHFCKMVKTSGNVTQVIYHDTDTITETGLFEEVKAYFNTWNLVRQQYLQFRMQEAQRRNLFLSGTDLIWSTNNKDGKVLMIEEGELNSDYTHSSAVIDEDGQLIEPEEKADAACLIENTLVSGGRVEIVPDGFLSEYNGLAMISRGTDNLCIYEHLPESTGREIFW